ncbi:helicase [Chrysodeixis chalcites SNPV TF1-A]|uniref:Helicase n=1 Tax=Chrysodeixis chalcites nucleopolyhedrovirus TaxID=320432 RepID=T1QZ35_9ABAC|nr:helicase [Chrysodeixis chalcites SNPV TF1-A]AGE61349.1 helicase [Chrysodeixis chalcites nucleopolyhedrovirus]
MAALPIRSNTIFDNIFKSIGDNNTVNVDSIVIVNQSTEQRLQIDNYENFEKLVLMLIDGHTETQQRLSCATTHDLSSMKPHDWFVEDNYFYLMVNPFIHVDLYDRIRDDINFEEFFNSNQNGFGNECNRVGSYYIWPNIPISYYGWRHYLLMKHDIDIGNRIPLIHNKSLGNVNLFVFNPEDFLNVELSIKSYEDNRTMFVNGRSRFDDSDEIMFHLAMNDGGEGVCRVKDRLVFSNKNPFDYIRDDINLSKCITAEKYKHMIQINLNNLRAFDKEFETPAALIGKEKLKAHKNITPSSENLDKFQQQILDCVETIIENMAEVLTATDLADTRVLQNYFIDSNFMNFDYIIIVIWRAISKVEELEFCKTDIKLYLELVVESIFGDKGINFELAKKRCEPYYRLTPKVFIRFCNHWAVFLNVDPCVSLAHYYAIHYLIYYKNKTWDYTYDLAKSCGATAEVLCSGFFNKIKSANTILVYNGKHYIAVKEKEDLHKLTESVNGITLPSVKFNNWKYLYFTEEGVYNLFINDYHSSCPFLLGNTLIKSLTRKEEKTYLPERVIQFMMDNGKNENVIYKTYHMAKICRDIRTLKNNMSIALALNNCLKCKLREQSALNDVFREIWHSDHSELITIGVYLSNTKLTDLMINLKCSECLEQKSAQQKKKCQCLMNIEINSRAFRIALIMELFSKTRSIIELSWSLLYSTGLYFKVLKDNLKWSLKKNHENILLYNNLEFFNEHRESIIDYLYSKIDRIDFIDNFITELSSPDDFIETLKTQVLSSRSCINQNNHDDNDDFADDNRINDSLKDVENEESKENLINFYNNYCNTWHILKRWNLWWDKLIIRRPNDDLNSWLVRFYMRIFMTKLGLDEYNSTFVKQIVRGYLYFRGFTNFNYINSLVMMHFGASMGIPSDYEKCCIYLNGKPGSGKSSFFELLEYIVVVHKHDSDKYTLSKKDTNEMEADKMISQLYVINEMKVCDDSFFKSTADSTKSNSVCRKFQGSQKYEANYKLLIVNNKPLHISDYDKGVRNRFAVIYTDHLFEENLPFNGSIYWHIKNKLYPMEKNYNEDLAKPVRIFLSHVLMYKRNAKDGYVPYKNIIKHDPIHNHNLLCLDVNNSPLNALIYVLKVEVKPGAKMIDETKIEKMIELAVPYVENMLHDLLVSKRNANGSQRIATLFSAFKRKYKKYYKEDEKCFYSIDMAWNKEQFNIHRPEFLC